MLINQITRLDVSGLYALIDQWSVALSASHAILAYLLLGHFDSWPVHVRYPNDHAKIMAIGRAIIISALFYVFDLVLPSMVSTIADCSHWLWSGPALRWIKHWIMPVSVKRNERILMIVSDIFVILWSICMAFIFLNHLTDCMSPEPNEPNTESIAVRLQLSMTFSPGLGVDVEADKVAVSEAVRPFRYDERSKRAKEQKTRNKTSVIVDDISNRYNIILVIFIFH